MSESSSNVHQPTAADGLVVVVVIGLESELLAVRLMDRDGAGEAVLAGSGMVYYLPAGTPNTAIRTDQPQPPSCPSIP